MILKLQEDKITAEQQLAEVSVMYGKAKVDVCVQARRHKQEADQKVEELQLQFTHLQGLSRLKDNKTTMVSGHD